MAYESNVGDGLIYWTHEFHFGSFTINIEQFIEINIANSQKEIKKAHTLHTLPHFDCTHTLSACSHHSSTIFRGNLSDPSFLIFTMQKKNTLDLRNEWHTGMVAERL